MNLNFKFLFVCLFVSINLFTGIVFASDNSNEKQLKTIVIGSDIWENVSNENKTGLIFDLTDLIFKKNNIAVKINLISYDESIKLIKEKKIDAAVGVYANEQTGVIYPKHFYSQEDVTACFKKGKFALKSDKELENKKVGFIKGYNFDKYLSVKVSITEEETRKELLDLLNKDKIDFYLDAAADINKSIVDNKLKKSDYEFSTIKMLNLYVVFADNEQGKQFAKIWDEEFKKSLMSNSIGQIYKKWKNLTFAGMIK